MTDTQPNGTTEEIEEMIQSIEEEIYNTKVFNSNLETEIEQLKNEVSLFYRLL